jgi:hypothetical protein
MDKIEFSKLKVLNLKNQIKEIEKLKSTYCYDREKMDREFCIGLSYQKWLLTIEYEKLNKYSY